MSDNLLIPAAHQLVNWLLVPTVGLLLVLVLIAIWEFGILIGERLCGLRWMHQHGNPQALQRYGRVRIERADILARVAPMLGLMGTLIPLGPGIAALSHGHFEVLADAVSIAFDTTVIGLAVGILGFIIGRLRRRWYDGLLDAWELAEATATQPTAVKPDDAQEPASNRAHHE